MSIIPFPDPEERLVAAIREYLASQVRYANDPEWETEPDFALLAVVRVMLMRVCYQRLVKALDRLGCKRAA